MMTVKSIVAANGSEYYPFISLTDATGRELHFAFTRQAWSGTKSQQRFYESMHEALGELRDVQPELLQPMTIAEKLADVRDDLACGGHAHEYGSLVRDYIELGGNCQEAIEIAGEILRNKLTKWIV